jgi:hypothetical protein
VDSVRVTDKPEAMMNCRIACEVSLSVTSRLGKAELTQNPVLLDLDPILVYFVLVVFGTCARAEQVKRGVTCRASKLFLQLPPLDSFF